MGILVFSHGRDTRDSFGQHAIRPFWQALPQIASRPFIDPIGARSV
jgi:hypothetical protein